jgi:sporulation related protein
MSSAAQLPEIDALPCEPPLPARKTRGVFVVFATMVTVGLALGGWYVGNRIMAAEGTQASSAPQAVTNEVLEAPKAIVEAPRAAPQELLPLAADYYLQIAALGASQDQRYVKQLQTKGFQVRLETAAADHEAQILIGPYSDERALRRAQTRLAATGILAMEAVR